METVKTLLGEIIDYAGLFPPAKLDMAPTLANYARHRAARHAWMLGRLIIPAARFDEFADCLAALDSDGPHASEPWHLSTLGGPGDDADTWHESLRSDLDAMTRLSAAHNGRLVLDAYERALPRSLIEARNTDAQAGFLEKTRAALGDESAPITSVALEVTLIEPWREALPTWVDVLAASSRMAPTAGGATIAVKIRTGGVTARQFPTPAQVACALAACAARSVPLKATAGLHHPLRHHNASVDCMMHGFLNVFGAAALLHVAEIDEAGAEAMLADTDAGHFTLDESGFGWREHRVSTAEISVSRVEGALSFGSCSFDEPVEDLVAAGLLEG